MNNKNSSTFHSDEADDLWKEGKFDEALNSITNAIRLRPAYIEYYIRRGNFFFELKQFDEAISDFTFAIDKYPYEETYYSSRGMVYEEKGDYLSAISDLTSAIMLTRGNDSGYISYRAHLYMLNKNYEKAMEDYNYIISLENDRPSHYFSRAKAFLEIGKTEEALSDLRNVLRLSDGTGALEEPAKYLIEQYTE